MMRRLGAKSGLAFSLSMFWSSPNMATLLSFLRLDLVGWADKVEVDAEMTQHGMSADAMMRGCSCGLCPLMSRYVREPGPGLGEGVSRRFFVLVLFFFFFVFAFFYH